MAMHVADSERLLHASEGDYVRALRRWIDNAQSQLVARHKGRIVRGTGDGLLIEFSDARSCMRAAFDLHQSAESGSATAGAGEFRLRAGAHLASCAEGSHYIDGIDANLTSRLTRLARPGELVITAELRDQLTDGLDADFEDMGYRNVGPLKQPVRLFRACRDKLAAGGSEASLSEDLRPALAVIPFRPKADDAHRWMIGELIAEGIIARLSHNVGLRVISRQSTSALRDFSRIAEIERHLGAAFVLAGSYGVAGTNLVVTAELAEAQGNSVLWRDEVRGPVEELLQVDGELLHRIAQAAAEALGKVHVHAALARPLPSLDSSMLLLAGISMTHSHSAKIFERGRQALAELAARHPRLALPRAWLGLWHVLNVIKGQSADVGSDSRRAHEFTMGALEAESRNAMALAVEGYVQCQLMSNPEEASKYLGAAVEANPSEPMAWLFKSVASTMWGSSPASVAEVHIARSLSPVDPLGYFFDLLTANAFFADHRQVQAIAYARKSIKANRQHSPTLRLLLTAEFELGRIGQARKTLDRLLALEPNLTLSSYMAMGSSASPMRQRCARALAQLGLAEGGQSQPQRTALNPPYLKDEIQAALKATRSNRGCEPSEATIVINGHGNIVAPGGVINVIQHRAQPNDQDLEPQ